MKVVYAKYVKNTQWDFRSSGRDIKFSDTSNEKLAVISYTSGTTGFSKGVMLSHNSLAANVRYAQNNMPLKSGDPIVSFLPLAHTYGCAFEFLVPLFDWLSYYRSSQKPLATDSDPGIPGNKTRLISYLYRW